jgi:hypothetical protein
VTGGVAIVGSGAITVQYQKPRPTTANRTTWRIAETDVVR